MNSNPLMSVVIPCFNGAATIRRQLNSLRTQTCETSYEVIIVDNRSTDDTKRIINEYVEFDKRFRYVPAMDKQGINYARNTGVAAARGKYILLCDADDAVSDNWISLHIDAFERGSTIVGGPLVHCLPNGEEIFREDQLSDHYSFLQWPTGANCGFRRDLYSELDSFDESFAGGGDEVEFFWRAQIAGHHLTFVENAYVSYVQRIDPRDIYLQSRGYGRSVVRLYAKFRDYGMPRPSILRSVLAILISCPQIIFLWKSQYLRRNMQRLGRNIGILDAIFGRGRVS